MFASIVVDEAKLAEPLIVNLPVTVILKPFEFSPPFALAFPVTNKLLDNVDGIVVVGGLLLSNFFARKDSNGWGAMQYPQLVLGMLAIFTYVGVEVSIQSNLGDLLQTPAFGSLSPDEI